MNNPAGNGFGFKAIPLSDEELINKIDELGKNVVIFDPDKELENSSLLDNLQDRSVNILSFPVQMVVKREYTTLEQCEQILKMVE